MAFELELRQYFRVRLLESCDVRAGAAEVRFVHYLFGTGLLRLSMRSFHGYLFAPLVGWLVGWFLPRLVGCLFGWLVGWGGCW